LRRNRHSLKVLLHPSLQVGGDGDSMHGVGGISGGMLDFGGATPRAGAALAEDPSSHHRGD